MNVLRAVGHALAIAGLMTWEILWALILGFALSAIVQALVRRETVVQLLGDDRDPARWQSPPGLVPPRRPARTRLWHLHVRCS